MSISGWVVVLVFRAAFWAQTDIPLSNWTNQDACLKEAKRLMDQRAIPETSFRCQRDFDKR